MRKNINMKTIKHIIISLTGTIPIIGLTREAPVTSTLPWSGVRATTVEKVSDFQRIITDVIGWVQLLFFIVSTLMIVLAAWGFLNSGGEAEKTKEARTKVIYAVVAIAVALIAGGVDSLVDTFVN